MSVKKYLRNMEKKSPKTFAKIERRWDMRMTQEVNDFIFGLLDQVNPKAKAVLDSKDWIIRGPEIESELWKLLKKVRHITQNERSKK